MQDQDELTTPNSQLATKNLNLLYDWWEELYPRDFLLTFKNYFFDHKKFFNEVFDEQWHDKVKPMAFLFTAIGVSLIIGTISPWGLRFSEEPPRPEAWRQITYNMNSVDFEVFNRAFGLDDFDNIPDTTAYFEAVDNRLMNRLGTNLPPTAKDLQDYFQKEGYNLLATRAEYVNLKQQVEHEKSIENKELTEIEQIILINLFVFYSMFFWLVSHQFFNKAKRSSRETVFVYMYGLGMLIFFVYIPFISIAGATDENLPPYVFLIFLTLLVIILYKIFSIFKYTHNTGFFGMIKIFIKTFFWPIFMIPILFKWAIRKIGLSK